VQSSDRPDRLQWWRAFRKHAQDANQWPYFDAVLHGGDPIKGRYLFEQRAEIACLRCHRITGKGGVVGPALDGLGQRASTQAILRSILYPNEVMAPGYVSERFTLQNEEEWVGVVLEEDDEAISVRLPSGVEQQLIREQIIEREPSLSAMPEGLIESLTPFEVRDLIGFLKSL
jgi:quinoprotein glucose dehydrogenase